MEYVNVIPINDIQIHSHHVACPCNPKVETTDSGFLIIHNSFDGRDIDELRSEIYIN